MLPYSAKLCLLLHENGGIAWPYRLPWMIYYNSVQLSDGTEYSLKHADINKGEGGGMETNQAAVTGSVILCLHVVEMHSNDEWPVGLVGSIMPPHRLQPSIC